MPTGSKGGSRCLLWGYTRSCVRSLKIALGLIAQGFFVRAEGLGEPKPFDSRDHSHPTFYIPLLGVKCSQFGSWHEVALNLCQVGRIWWYAIVSHTSHEKDVPSTVEGGVKRAPPEL